MQIVSSGDNLHEIFKPIFWKKKKKEKNVNLSSAEHAHIILIIGSLINMQVQGQHLHQWAPFQIAGFLHAWQISHQISRYVYQRVDSRELPLSAVPLCQLLPCHFGPPRPKLSISLYVKGCLDCTTGAFHVSIPSESSLLQNEVQILNAKPHK